MKDYDLDIKVDLTLLNKRVGVNNPEYIVLHQTKEPVKAQDRVDFYKEFDVGLSTHYVIDDEEIIQVVEDDAGSFHIVDGYITGEWFKEVTTENSIGITLCLNDDYDIDNGSFKLAVELVKYLTEKYSIDANNVLRHYDVSGKDCPSAWRDDSWETWWNFKEKIGSDRSSVSSTGISVTSNEILSTDIEVKTDDLKILDRVNNTFTPNEQIPLYKDINGYLRVIDYYEPTEVIGFDTTLEDDNYVWLSYKRFTDDERRYLPLQDKETGLNYGTISTIDHDPNLIVFNQDNYEVVSEYSDEDTFMVLRDVYVRIEPTRSAPYISKLNKYQSFNYDMVTVADDFVWLSYLNPDGTRCYVPVNTYSKIRGEGHEPWGMFISKDIEADEENY